MGAGCAERFTSGSARGSGCDSPGLLSWLLPLTTADTVKTDTPASVATSYMLGVLFVFRLRVFFSDNIL
jgi:hypothetical protein